MHGLTLTTFCLDNVGFGAYGVVVNEGMYRVSIVCKKRGCPRIDETRDVDAKGRF